MAPQGGIAEASVAEAGVGYVVAGKFRVERVIGEGGMGIVVEATHLQLEERVALKFLHRSALSSPEVVSRFKQEARAAVRLKSEHIARVIDVGTREDGAPFMVMELLEGSDLAGVLASRGALPIAEAVEYVIQACEGVAEAHARGIVHRDIKPENLFLVRRDSWQFIKVLDFGISKAALAGSGPLVGGGIDLATAPASLHKTNALLGSPLYMSPEQLRSTSSVDHRADIWSLGVTLFELVTRTMPFDDTKQFMEVASDIIERPHRSVAAIRPEAAGLQPIIDRCLEKDRDARFQSAAELAIALLPFAPRRARVTAERAMAVSRAANMLSDPKLALPPSIYPAAPSDPIPQANDRASGLSPIAAMAPPPGSSGIVHVGAQGNVPFDLARTQHAPDTGPAPATAPSTSARNALIGALVAMFVVLAAIGALIAFKLTRKDDAPPAPAPAATVAAATETPTVATAPVVATANDPAPTAAPPSSGTAITARATATAAAHAIATTTTAVGRRPAPGSTPSASASAAAGGDLEIRRER